MTHINPGTDTTIKCCHYDVCYMIHAHNKCINDKLTEIPCIFDSRKEINFSRCASHTPAPAPIPLCDHFGNIDCCPVKEQCPALHYCSEHYRHVDKSLIERNEASRKAREDVLKQIKQHLIDEYHYPDVEDWLIEELMGYIQNNIESTQQQAGRK